MACEELKELVRSSPLPTSMKLNIEYIDVSDVQKAQILYEIARSVHALMQTRKINYELAERILNEIGKCV